MPLLNPGQSLYARYDHEHKYGVGSSEAGLSKNGSWNSLV